MNRIFLYILLPAILSCVVEANKLAGGHSALFLYYAYKLDYLTNLKYASDGKTQTGGHSRIAQGLMHKVNGVPVPTKVANFDEFLEYVTWVPEGSTDKRIYIPLEGAGTSTPALSLGTDSRLVNLQHDMHVLLPNTFQAGSVPKLAELYDGIKGEIQDAMAREHIREVQPSNMLQYMLESATNSKVARTLDDAEKKLTTFRLDFNFEAVGRDKTVEGVTFKAFNLDDTLKDVPADWYDTIRTWDTRYGTVAHRQSLLHNGYDINDAQNAYLTDEQRRVITRDCKKRRKNAIQHKSSSGATDDMVDFLRTFPGCERPTT